MQTLHPQALRLVAASLLSSVLLSVSAQAAYVPNWTQQSYYIFQDIQVGGQADKITDITVSSTGALPIADTLSDTSAVSTADGTSSLSYSGGTFYMYLAPTVSSVGASTSQYGYALSEAGIDGRFIANTATLYVNYTIDGSMYANNPANDLAYASLAGGFSVEDVLLGYSSSQVFDWVNLYDDNGDGSGTFSYPLLANGTSTILLTPGRQYRFSLDVVADALSSGTSAVGVPTTVSFSFSTSPVPEPSKAAMMAFGLACLAGMQRVKSKRAA